MTAAIGSARYVWIPTSEILAYADPFSAWGETQRVTMLEIWEAARAGRAGLVDTPCWWESNEYGLAINHERARQRHIDKIAYFFLYGFEAPITIDVGCPGLGCHVEHIIQDGNHRLCGAIARAQSLVPAFFCGDEDLLEAMFCEGAISPAWDPSRKA